MDGDKREEQVEPEADEQVEPSEAEQELDPKDSTGLWNTLTEFSGKQRRYLRIARG